MQVAREMPRNRRCAQLSRFPPSFDLSWFDLSWVGGGAGDEPINGRPRRELSPMLSVSAKAARQRALAELERVFGGPPPAEALDQARRALQASRHPAQRDRRAGF